MRKPRALDLFSKAGGATKGLQLAGFEVWGVDIEAQPRYCGDHFIQGDALELAPFYAPLFDFVWASPPCQKHTAMKTMHNAKTHVDLIPQIREKLKASGVPYVIENVVGAPLINPVTLCGTMFGLGCDGAELHRHRQFEASFPLFAPECRHTGKPVIGIYGGHVRNRKRRAGSQSRGVEDFPIQAGHEAMGIDWMTLGELSQAIPPAYSQSIGHAALAHIRGLELAA